MPWRSRCSYLPALVLLASGCSEFRFDPIDPGTPAEAAVSVTEQFVQAPPPAVDVLLVVDDTASMASEQAALAVQFAAFADALAETGSRWQIGVVGMSLEPFGWMLGSPYILTPDTASAGQRLADLSQVGTAGAGPETGFSAALAALELASSAGPNSGFLREGAVLHVIFVSDDDDASVSLGADRAGAFVSALGAWSTQDRLPVVSAIIGDLPDGCSSAAGEALPGFAFAEAVEATGGTLASICAPDLGPFSSAIDDQTVVLNVRFPLVDLPLPARPVTVLVDGVRAEGWSIESDPPAVVFAVPPPAGAVVDVTYLVGLTS